MGQEHLGSIWRSSEARGPKQGAKPLQGSVRWGPCGSEEPGGSVIGRGGGPGAEAPPPPCTRPADPRRRRPPRPGPGREQQAGRSARFHLGAGRSGGTGCRAVSGVPAPWPSLPNVPDGSSHRVGGLCRNPAPASSGLPRPRPRRRRRPPGRRFLQPENSPRLPLVSPGLAGAGERCQRAQADVTLTTVSPTPCVPRRCQPRSPPRSFGSIFPVPPPVTAAR